MRQTTAFFAVFASLSLLPACDKLEEQVESKAKTKAESVVVQKAGFAMSGQVLTMGICPDWPASIPVYPNRKSVICEKLDAAQIQSSPQFKMYLASQPPHEAHAISEALAAHPNDLTTLQLTVTTSDSPEAVGAFYAKAFPDSGGVPVGIIPVQPLLFEKASASKPGSFSLRTTIVDPQSNDTIVNVLLVHFPSEATKAD